MNRADDRAFESMKVAEHHESKAAGIEAALERTIFDDDPDAIERLEARIAAHEAKRDGMKSANAWWKKHGTMAGFETVTPERAVKMDAEIREMYVKRPWPSYSLTNIGARIRTDKQRIEHIKRRHEHTQDADCRPFLMDGEEEGTGECSVCHVLHGDPCPACGGRGFHLPDCPTMAIEGGER